jgi:hypothetical protein
MISGEMVEIFVDVTMPQGFEEQSLVKKKFLRLQ